MKRIVFNCIVGAIAVAAIAALLWSYNNIHIYGKTSHIPADCNNSGKDARICTICGKMVLTDAEPPTDHTFSDWRVYNAATSSSFGTDIRTCTICGIYETRKVDNTSQLPKLYFNGSAIGLSASSSIVAQFGSSPENFTHASFLMMDDNEERKLSYIINVTDDGDNVNLGSFGPGKQVLLYAHNDEPTHSHAIVHTELWSEVLEGYDDVKRFNFCSADEGKTIAGELCMLYIRNKYAGIYTLSLPYDKLFGFNVHLPDACAVVRANDELCDIVYLRNGDSTGIEESFSRFINSCKDNVTLGGARYSDINLLADYYNFCDMSGFSTGLSSDVLWITPDRVKWYPIPASNEGDTFGSVYGKTSFSDPSENTAFEYGYSTDAVWESLVTQSKLIYESFDKLSNGIMSEENVKATFTDKFAALDAKLVEDEFRVYNKNYSEEIVNDERIYDWYRLRLDKLSAR